MSTSLLPVARLLEPALQPLGLAFLLLLAGFAHSIRRLQITFAILFLVPAALLWTFGATPLPTVLLASLERPYLDQSLTNAPKADAILVLGGFLNDSAPDPLRFEVTGAFDRVLSGIELARRGLATNLVVAGSANPDLPHARTEGQAVIEWIGKWGMLPAGVSVIPLPACQNTREEAQRTWDLARTRQWKHIVLVTSAFHLRRATPALRSTGLEVTPVACDFRAARTNPILPGYSIFPSVDNLQLATLYLHEEVSWQFYHFRGWLQ